jgi:predicted transcriptional regulator
VGLTQVDLARRLGLSASYLNLIEHNQRPLTAKLLIRISKVLDVETGVLSDDGERESVSELTEILTDPVFSAGSIEASEIVAAVRTSPAMSNAMLTLYLAYCSQRDKASALGEAVRRREALAEVNYDFRTLVASIRSSAEILADNPDLDLAQRRRFLGVVVENSKRLVPLFGDLLETDSTADISGGVSGRPAFEDIADFLHTTGSYFADLEDAADWVRKAAGISGIATDDRLASCLARERTGPEHPEIVLEDLSIEARRLAIAKRVAIERCADVIAHCSESVEWAAPGARSVALDALAEYLAEAILMPYDLFLAAAHEVRHDIERLQWRFGVGFEQVCRRLTTLKRPGAKGVPFYLVKVDMAGNVLWRLGSPGFRIPRYNGVCTLWNVHAAFLTPEVTRVQLSRMPDGRSYFSIARALRCPESKTVRSPRYLAVELGCDTAFARDLVYADGLELTGSAVAVPVGTTCRLCERLECPHRVLPPLRQPAKMADGGSMSSGG